MHLKKEDNLNLPEIGSALPSLFSLFSKLCLQYQRKVAKSQSRKIWYIVAPFASRFWKWKKLKRRIWERDKFLVSFVGCRIVNLLILAISFYNSFKFCYKSPELIKGEQTFKKILSPTEGQYSLTLSDMGLAGSYPCQLHC